MKKLFWAALLFIFGVCSLVIVSNIYAKSVTIKLAWDPNTEPDLAQYVIYHRVEGQGFDYGIPIKIVPAPTTTGNATFEVPDGEIVLNHFVIRAEDTNENQSGDSNEVSAIIDLRVPLAPTLFTGVYNDVSETIDFTWSQTNPEIVSLWKIFMAASSGGPYNQVGSDIVNDGSTYSASWKVPSDGDYFFALVAFREKNDTLSPDAQQFTSIEPTFSVNSNEVVANVQIHPSPVKMFKIKLRVYQ